MADALVELLNSLGYQPVFLPRTGLEPPELYNFIEDGRRLLRRGPLQAYLPPGLVLPVTHGDLADIEHTQTSGKRMKAAAGFLERALRCIGITDIPRLDLSFTDARSFTFSLTGV